jgi:hypothetical protein
MKIMLLKQLGWVKAVLLALAILCVGGGMCMKAIPANAGEKDKQKALADFTTLYALKPGEVLKRVGTPFPPSRFVYHRQHYPKDDKAEDMMFLRWDNGLQFCGTIGGMKSDQRKVQLIFLLRYLPSMIGAHEVLPDGRRELDV